MVSRLVLASGTVGHAVVEAIERESIAVVTDDEDLLDRFEGGDISISQGELTARETLTQYEPGAVLIAVDDPEHTKRILSTVAVSIPNAVRIAYADSKMSSSDRNEVEKRADTVIDYAETTSAAVIETVDGDGAQKARTLWRMLQAMDGPLCVLAHDNPDPDAIAAAVALANLAEERGVDAQACYFGEITHQENRALVNLLDLDLRELEPGEEQEYDSIALVDHSVPGTNDQLPDETPIAIVIDHHTSPGPVDAEFADLRSDIGATSTILTEYYRWLDVTLDDTTATALLYGIRTDTNDFARAVSQLDFEAATSLLRAADLGVLSRIESPSLSGATLETLARAIHNREVRGSVLVSFVGRLRERDALSQASDRLLSMEDVTTTLVYGVKDDTIYISGRTRGSDVHLGESVRAAFDQIGSAGGHADMAGAQIPIGVLGSVDPDSRETLMDVVSEVVRERFFEAIVPRLEDEINTVQDPLTTHSGNRYSR